MDSEEIRALQSSLRDMFAQTKAEPGAVVTALHELGWHDVVTEEPTAEALLFEEHGRAQVVSRLLDDAVLAALGLQSAGTAVAYPLSRRDALMSTAAVLDGDQLTLDAVVRTTAGVPESILVPTATTMLLVPSQEVDVCSVAGLDPDGSWSRLVGDVQVETSWSAVATAPWSVGVATGRRLLAAELVGLARAALDLATSHVTARHQFGRPIGSFQAVRFRLADAKVAIEAAAEAVRLAFAELSPLASAVAKALAGSAADIAVRQAMQVCGAMGLTWEFPLHPIIRRSYALDLLLGDTWTLTLALGRHVTGTAPMPQLDPLVAGNY
jgi:alkylation response protein AidB-like acyl-CoA dehydrogenase